MVKLSKNLHNVIDVKNLLPKIKVNQHPVFLIQILIKNKYHFASLNVSWYTDHWNALQLTTVNCVANGQ